MSLSKSFSVLFRKLSVLFLFALAMPLCAGSVVDIKFKQFSTSDGLPNSMVHGIYQDHEGFMWIPTFYGLYRYDGYGIRTYKSNIRTPGLLPNNNVLCVAEDGSHRLWIGTHAGLCMLDMHSGRMRRLTLGGTTRQRLNEICVTKHNKVYLGYISGMAYYDVANDRLVRMTAGNSNGDVPCDVNIQSLIEENGDLLIGTWKDGLYRYNVRENRFIHYPPLDSTNSIMALFQDSHGTMWVGTSGGGIHKVRFSADRRTVSVEKTYRSQLGVLTSLPSDYIYSINEDLHTRTLWVGTRSGLAVMPFSAEGVFTDYSATSMSHYLPVNEVSAVLRDRSGMMWVSTKGAGVFQADTRQCPFAVIWPKDKTGKHGDLVSTLYVKDGACKSGKEIYIGRGYGVEYIGESGSTVMIPKSRPYSISYSNKTDRVLMAVHDGGILVCKKGKVEKQYNVSNCNFIPHDLVYCVHEDTKGNWWVGSYCGLGVRYTDGREAIFSKVHGASRLTGKEITAITSDNDGSLWLAVGNDGIVHVTGDMDNPRAMRYKSYSASAGTLPAGTPLCLFISGNGRLWIGTEGSGLCLYDPQHDTFQSVHLQYNLPGDMVASIEEDSQGNLWLGTNQGLACLKVTANGKGYARIFTVADGLPDNFFIQSASCNEGGLLYFGSSNGVVAFNPQTATGGHSDVLLRVTDILVDGQSLEDVAPDERKSISQLTAGFTSHLVIPSGYTSFAVCFASLDYRQQSKTKYSYMLKGYDDAWHHVAASSRKASYSHLPSGSYVLVIRATDESGTWGRPLVMTVEVLPPFYATWQACVVYVLLFLLLGYGIWWEIRRRMMQRNKTLVQEGKTDEVHQMKLQIFTNITNEDEQFLEKAVACVNKHLDDADFSVTQFVEEMATSRTVLHKKLKSVTGQSATAFVRSIRLKAACQILDANSGIRISELAYRVGFNDPKYFSICFKKEFGMQPSEYAAKAADVE